jgi:hypothetical protein
MFDTSKEDVTPKLVNFPCTGVNCSDLIYCKARIIHNYQFK